MLYFGCKKCFVKYENPEIIVFLYFGCMGYLVKYENPQII